MLEETETIWLLDIPSTWVEPDDENIDNIRKMNERYTEVSASTS